MFPSGFFEPKRDGGLHLILDLPTLNHTPRATYCVIILIWRLVCHDRSKRSIFSDWDLSRTLMPFFRKLESEDMWCRCPSMVLLMHADMSPDSRSAIRIDMHLHVLQIAVLQRHFHRKQTMMQCSLPNWVTYIIWDVLMSMIELDSYLPTVTFMFCYVSAEWTVGHLLFTNYLQT